MIKFGIIQALRRLPAEFAEDVRTEVCEARGFLLASRPEAESLCWRFRKGGAESKNQTWVLVSAACCMDGSVAGDSALAVEGFERYEHGGFVTSTRGRRARSRMSNN